MECRISAYSDYTGFRDINRQAPDFLFAGDLDLCRFKSEGALKVALDATLTNIKEKLGGTPTILSSGNGYHVYQPIKGLVLEQLELFSKFDQPSRSFLRFAEWYLSNSKSDVAHNTTISFRNCMLRVPGSYNTKCVIDERESEVKIIQQWDGYRPNINLLLGNFRAYLVDQGIKKKEVLEYSQRFSRGRSNNNNNISWIESLLKTPVGDYRKYVIWRIIAPYVVNVRKLSFEEAFHVMKDWLNQCCKITQLDFNADQRIRDNLNAAIRVRYLPIRFSDLKAQNKELHGLISNIENGKHQKIHKI